MQLKLEKGKFLKAGSVAHHQLKPGTGFFCSSRVGNYDNVSKTIFAKTQDVQNEFRIKSNALDRMQTNFRVEGSSSSQVSTGLDGLDTFIGGGYPDSAAILITGPPGVGKEALGYWFIKSGLKLDDFCLYVTHRPVSHVLRDMTAFGVDREQTPNWIASVGSPNQCDLNDPTNISFMIKQLVERNKGKRARIVTDVLSPLLVLNPADVMYRYWTQLTSELRRYDAVLLAMGEDGMHSPTVVASMEQLFDGVIEMKLFENGLSFTPLLRVKKMLGVIPKPGYFRFSLTNNDLEILGNVK